MSIEESSQKEEPVVVDKIPVSGKKPDNPPIETFEEDDNVPVVKNKGISYWAAVTNFIRTLLGVGCLALPVALKQSGWVVGLVLIFAFGFLNAHCMLILVHCAQYLSRKRGENRLELGEVALDACSNSFDYFRNHGSVFNVYYVFVTIHLQEIIEQYTNIRLSETQWLLLMFVPFVLVNCLRTLRVIAVLSGLGNIVMCGCLIIIFQHLIRQPHISLFDLPSVNSFDGIMTASGSILAAFEGQALILPLENKIKKSEQMLGFTGVISTGMSTVTVIYSLCGFLGFITYGDRVKGSIALNLPEDLIFSIVRGCLALVVFTGFAIQQYAVIEVTFPTIIEGVPGAITFGMLIAFVFPPVIEILTFLPGLIKKYKRSPEGRKWCFGRKIAIMLVKDLFLICLGIFGLVAGLQASIKNLVK
ncbi:hypothetical protein FO519_008600 [Halicephalobus sp. NKZ332]|nr:hypothetical protein FO519_008600 [Halicephalobus sp. NKZ332]